MLDRTVILNCLHLEATGHFVKQKQSLPLKVADVGFQAFTLTKVNAFILSYQLCQLVKNYKYFRYNLCPHNQGSM
jgi:hypothetical protein